MFLTEEEKKIIISILTEDLEPQFIYVFGSYAIGEARSDSDVDIAIYQDCKIDPYKLFQVSNKISLKLKRDIDLVSLREVSTVFAAQIISKSEIIYSKDESLRQNYSIKIFKEYVKLNEEREVVLNSIREDGSIYGKWFYK
ncbi:MAG: nucleotidyltransferase domain-containing protein [Tissierellia bacterium]|nr:nucleotidyltransferase domain-containing protein [Tissierellia bacterium]